MSTDANARNVNIRNFSGVIRVRSEDTDGALAVVEHTLPPGYVAMPLHRNTRETATTHVLEGTLTIKLNGRIQRAHAGAWVVKPKGSLHTYWNAGDRPVRFLEVYTPGGMEKYFEEMDALVPRSGEVPIARVMELSRAYGMEIEMESLLDIIETHHVQLA